MVKLYKHYSHNEELILHYFKNQSLLGEMATFEGIPYPANAIAETNCDIWTIKKEDFVALLEATPHLALQIITSMGMKIKMLENSIDLNISKNSMQRVVSLILNTIDIFGEFSRVKISGILNMKPETLSRRIQTLKQEGAIEVSGKKIIIIDRAALKKYLN
jgi:CRP/FNR family transcriptional regulator